MKSEAREVVVVCAKFFLALSRLYATLQEGLGGSMSERG